FDRAGVSELYLRSAVVIGGSYRKPDLIACDRGFRKGKVELVPEHLARKRSAFQFEPEGQVLRFAAAALLLAHPDPADLGSQDPARAKHQTDYGSGDPATHPPQS